MVSYRHPRPALTVDSVVFGLDGDELRILLVKRKIAPFKGRWALPGGFVHTDETLEEAARRELAEETGATDVYLEQLFTFGEVERDPRERVVSVAYWALVRASQHEIKAASDAREAIWHPASRPPPLAFDHDHILGVALRRLRAKVRYEPVGFELLPATFTLSQLQGVYEAILDRPLDKRNFRKKILSYGLLRETRELHHPAAGRPARLYRFDRPRYERLRERGIDFLI